MSTTLVRHAVDAPPGSVVRYQLCAPAFDGGHVELLGLVKQVRVARDGTCPLRLTPNVELTKPAGTWWVVTNPDQSARTIIVPVSAVPVELDACLVDNPTAPGTPVGDPAGTASRSMALERQRARQDHDRRALRPLCTDEVTVTADTVSDPLCVRTYSWPAAGLTDGTIRLLTSAEQAACPMDLGLSVDRVSHFLYYTGGNSYGFVGPVSPAYGGGSPGFMPRRVRLRTTSDRLQFVRYHLAGNTRSGSRVTVDGRPYAIRPAAGTSTVDFLHLVFADNQPREVEIFTWALLGPVGWRTNYDVWRPSTSNAPIVYTLTASDGDTVFNDAGTAAGLQEEVWHAEYECLIGAQHHILDAIAGTGWINRNANANQAPNNSYVDRVGAVLRCNPDVLQHPSGAANDISYRNQVGVRTDADIIAAMRAVWGPYRAQNPTGKIIYGTALLSPYFQAWRPQFLTLRDAARTACADLGVYWVATEDWLTGTGDTGNVKNDGNCDWAIGADNAHPTAKGAAYLRRRWASALKRILTDDGTLLNTVLTG